MAVAPVFTEWLERSIPGSPSESWVGSGPRGGKLNVSEFGARMRGTGEMAGQIAALFRLYARKHGLDEGCRPRLDAIPPAPAQVGPVAAVLIFRRGDPQKSSRRASASPKRSSLTPMRSMIDRYILQSLRSRRPGPCSRARGRFSVPPRPPARTTGSLLASCWVPDHMLL